MGANSKFGCLRGFTILLLSLSLTGCLQAGSGGGGENDAEDDGGSLIPAIFSPGATPLPASIRIEQAMSNAEEASEAVDAQVETAATQINSTSTIENESEASETAANAALESGNLENAEAATNEIDADVAAVNSVINNTQNSINQIDAAIQEMEAALIEVEALESSANSGLSASMIGAFLPANVGSNSRGPKARELVLRIQRARTQRNTLQTALNAAIQRRTRMIAMRQNLRSRIQNRRNEMAAAERAQQEQAAREKAEQEARERAAEQTAREQREREAAEEAARIEAERQAAEQAAREQAEREAAEEAARIEAERQAAEQAAREQAEREAAAEAARLEAERQAAEQAAREEAERAARAANSGRLNPDYPGYRPGLNDYYFLDAAIDSDENIYHITLTNNRVSQSLYQANYRISKGNLRTGAYDSSFANGGNFVMSEQFHIGLRPQKIAISNAPGEEGILAFAEDTGHGRNGAIPINLTGCRLVRGTANLYSCNDGILYQVDNGIKKAQFGYGRSYCRNPGRTSDEFSCFLPRYGVRIYGSISNYNERVSRGLEPSNLYPIGPIGGTFNGETDPERYKHYRQIIKISKDGEKDASFGTNGIVEIHKSMLDREGKLPTQEFASGAAKEKSAFEVLEDGSVMIAGIAEHSVPNPYNANSTTSSEFYFILKFNSDGSLDSEFGNNGLVTFLQNESNDQSQKAFRYNSSIAKIDKQSGAVFLLSHIESFSQDFEFRNKTLLTKVSADGSIDEDFSRTATEIINSVDAGYEKRQMRVDEEGRLLIARELPTMEFIVYRFMDSGQLNSSFADGDGLYRISPQEQNNFNGNSIASFHLSQSGELYIMTKNRLSNATVVTSRAILKVLENGEMSTVFNEHNSEEIPRTDLKFSASRFHIDEPRGNLHLLINTYNDTQLGTRFITEAYNK